MRYKIKGGYSSVYAHGSYWHAHNGFVEIPGDEISDDFLEPVNKPKAKPEKESEPEIKVEAETLPLSDKPTAREFPKQPKLTRKKGRKR